MPIKPELRRRKINKINKIKKKKKNNEDKKRKTIETANKPAFGFIDFSMLFYF